jgi:methyl-galactoside transport system ATP-binding protein
LSEYRLEMCDVVKTFPGVKALNHAQLKLKPGTVHALMGENGAGKSTLMKCMFGIYHMDEGKVIYEGQEVQIKGPLDALNRGIAMVHQELQPIPERSIGENIYVGRYPTKKYGPVTVIDHDKMYEDAAKVLKEVHLNYDPHAKLGTLSVSQMQLVEIAKAVSADCKVLILDEPTAGLDPAGCRGVLENIAAYRRETGSAVLLVTHSMDDAARIADRLIVFHAGHVAFDGAPAEVFAHTQELLDIGLDVPQAARIAQALRDRGIPLPSSIYTLEQLTDALLAVGKEAGVC